MSNDDQFDDLDLEQIAREALADLANNQKDTPPADELSEAVEDSIDLPASISNADTKINLDVAAESSVSETGWPSENTLAKLQATAAVLAEQQKNDNKNEPDETGVSKTVAVPFVPKAKPRESKPREVTKIAKVAPSMTADSAQRGGSESIIPVGRAISRSSQSDRTVVFKAKSVDGSKKQTRAIRLDTKNLDTEMAELRKQMDDPEKPRKSNALKLSGPTTEKGIPFSEIPMTEPLGITVPGTANSAPVELGTVVIEVPAKAEVYVNGEPRGMGRVVLENMDRFVPFWVRVHLEDHDPWSAEVSLKGQRAAKIQPEMY